MNQTEHTSMLQLLSVQITGDAAVLSSEKAFQTDAQPAITPAHTDQTETTKLEQTIKSDTPIATDPLVNNTSAPASPSKESKQDKEDIIEGNRMYHEALAYIKDAISPAMMKITPQDIQINDTFCKTLFTYAYPDFLD